MRSFVLCDANQPEKVLPFCEKHRLGIEIQGFYNTNHLDQTQERIAAYQSMLPKGCEKYLHAPFWDLCLGSGNQKIVEVTRFFFDYADEVAEALGCEGIVVHHGYVPNTSHPSNWIDRSVVFWRDFFDAHPGNRRMFMENLSEKNAETMLGVVDRLRNPRLMVNLDIGHVHCNSDVAVLDWIEQLGARISYVHIHQNHGKRDEHLGLRKGNIPMKSALEALQRHAPDAVWALECNVDEMEESLNVLMEYGYLG